MSTVNKTNTRQHHDFSEDEWKSIEETLYLSSVPGFVDSVNDIRKNEDWDKAKEFSPNK